MGCQPHTQALIETFVLVFYFNWNGGFSELIISGGHRSLLRNLSLHLQEGEQIQLGDVPRGPHPHGLLEPMALETHHDVGTLQMMLNQGFSASLTV